MRRVTRRKPAGKNKSSRRRSNKMQWAWERLPLLGGSRGEWSSSSKEERRCNELQLQKEEEEELQQEEKERLKRTHKAKQLSELLIVGMCVVVQVLWC